MARIKPTTREAFALRLAVKEGRPLNGVMQEALVPYLGDKVPDQENGRKPINSFAASRCASVKGSLRRS